MFVPVYDPSKVFDLWEAGLLCNSDGITMTCNHAAPKEYYVGSWTRGAVCVKGDYGYWEEE